MAPHHIGGLKQEHPRANTTVLQPLSPNVEHLPMDITGVDTFLRGEDCFMREPIPLHDVHENSERLGFHLVDCVVVAHNASFGPPGVQKAGQPS